MGFSGGSDGKSIFLHCEGPGFDPWVGKIPWRREWLPTPVFLPGEFHGLRKAWQVEDQCQFAKTWRFPAFKEISIKTLAEHNLRNRLQ